MSQPYYKLPLQFKLFMKKNEEEIKMCDMETSIAENIYLMITSKHKERRFDETYGCEVWDMDFEMINNQGWLERVKASVLSSITRHEPRLYGVHVDITISQEEKAFALNKTVGIKKKLNILILGRIRQTGREFNFDTNIYLSPLSLD